MLCWVWWYKPANTHRQAQNSAGWGRRISSSRSRSSFARHKMLSENKQNKCTRKTFPFPLFQMVEVSFSFQAPSYFYNNWLSLKWCADTFMSTDKFLFGLWSLTALVEPSFMGSEPGVATGTRFTNINYPNGRQWSPVCSEPEGIVFVGWVSQVKLRLLSNSESCPRPFRKPCWSDLPCYSSVWGSPGLGRVGFSEVLRTALSYSHLTWG